MRWRERSVRVNLVRDETCPCLREVKIEVLGNMFFTYLTTRALVCYLKKSCFEIYPKPKKVKISKFY